MAEICGSMLGQLKTVENRYGVEGGMGNGTPLPVVFALNTKTRASEYTCPCHPWHDVLDFCEGSGENVALSTRRPYGIEHSERAAFGRECGVDGVFVSGCLSGAGAVRGCEPRWGGVCGCGFGGGAGQRWGLFGGRDQGRESG